jgi:hypothetical protein
MTDIAVDLLRQLDRNGLHLLRDSLSQTIAAIDALLGVTPAPAVRNELAAKAAERALAKLGLGRRRGVR